MDDTSKITNINGFNYEYEYTLSNKDGEIKFRDAAVVDFSITDNIFNPFADGHITVVNSYNHIESQLNLRGDGTDIFKIKFGPKEQPERVIEYEFVVLSEINHIDDATEAKNRKTFILTAKDEILLSETFPYGKRCRGKVGDIIKDLLETTGLTVNKDVFEPGNITISAFPEFIIPSSSYRYKDLLYYLLQYYYYIDGDLSTKGFLSKGSKGYELKTLSKDFFSKNEELVYEHFHAGDLVSKPTTNSNNPMSLGGEYKIYNNNIVSNNLTTPTEDISNSFLMNALVVGYDPILGVSRMKEVRLQDVREKWAKKFVDVFKSVGGKPKKYLNLKATKKEGQFKQYRLPFNVIDNANIVEADMVNSFLFYNQQLNINVMGDTGRKSGTFIDMFKVKDEKVKTDQKLLGRWFITSVRHVKIANTFRNEIYCVKPYAGPDYNDTDA